MQNEQKPRMIDYLFILYKWKRFLIINLFIVFAITTLIALLIPLQFKATSTVMVKSNDDAGLGGISSMLSGGSVAAMGAQILGIGGGSTDLMFGLLNSRGLRSHIIQKFNLMNYYEIDDNNLDKALLSFKADYVFEPNENGAGLIDVSIINKDPQTAAKIANYIIKYADSLNIQMNVQQAKNNRVYIERRYLKNVEDLKFAEDSMYFFQKKYGVVAIPEQLELSFKAAAEIEAQLVQQQLAADLIENQAGKESPQYIAIKNQVNNLKQKIEELKNSSKLPYTSNILFPFKEIPEMSLKYFRYYREIELQSKIMEFLLPMYEQAKVEEQKSTPTLLILDDAVPPQLKDSPKRAFIILGVGFVFLFFFLLLVFRGEEAARRESFRNILDEKESRFYKKILRLYRFKI